jgi:glutamate racemase
LTHSFKPVKEPVNNLEKLPIPTDPIGIFDSGVGGLSIYREVRRLLPAETILYVADQAHVPYGVRTLEEVQRLSEGITRFLLDRQVKIIVIACNTASAAALQYLREIFKDYPFVGMEPAVKPAVQKTLSQRVGVLATQATFQGALYASVIERFAQNVKVYEDACPGLVSQIEKGDFNSVITRRILETAIQPMLSEGVDTIVLGCTHYPFVIPLIKEIAGPGVAVIDPSPAIARQTQRILEEKQLLNLLQKQGVTTLFSSAYPNKLQSMLPHLIGEALNVLPVSWLTDSQGTQQLFCQ